MIRILTKNGVDNTNVDGARDHNFNAGRRSGIVQGALNQGNFFASNNNTIALDTCELRLCGHRIVLDKAEYRTFTNKPSVPVRYSFVARVVVDSDDNVSFEFVSQEATTQLVQDNLDITGSGTYELEIGKFTQLTDGNITDVVRTADLITGGADNDSDYIRIGTVTTNKISPELDADVDIENTINPTDNKPQTNFTFNLPTAVGTVVSVNGEEKTAINTDLTPTANSENLITSGGVHDYPAIAFAESERQKSKNLLNSKNIIQDSNGNSCLDISNLVIGKQYTFSTNIPIGWLKISNVASGSTSVEKWSPDGFYDFTFTMTKNSNIPDADTQYLYLGNSSYQIYSAEELLSRDLQIEEGTVATDYQSYNGAIVHEKDVADVEHIDLLYDMSSSDANINRGFTVGVKFDDSAEMTNIINVDTTVYDHFIVTCKSKSNFYTGICNKPYSTVVGSNLYLGNSVVANNLLISNTYIRPIDCYEWTSSWTNHKNDVDFVVTKIIGVK